MTKFKREFHTKSEAFRFRPSFANELQNAADSKGVSKALIIVTAVEQWLDREFPGWRRDESCNKSRSKL